MRAGLVRAPGDLTEGASMSLTVYRDMLQGSEDWFAARLGMLTASEVAHIITPTGTPAKNEKMRAHAYELLAQRITGHIEPRYISDDMLRGHDDEVDARVLYSHRYAPVAVCGFMVREFDGFRIGYSPDGLVGEDGVIEVKGRRAKLQIATIIEDAMPPEHAVQVQTGLLVSGRSWCDFLSYSGGMPMAVYRVDADAAMQGAIIAAAVAFEEFIAAAKDRYLAQIRCRSFCPTERRIEQEMMV